VDIDSSNYKDFFKKTGIHTAYGQEKEHNEREPENSALVKSLKNNSNLSRIRSFEVRDMIFNNGRLTTND
jgi:hypothetical protein